MSFHKEFVCPWEGCSALVCLTLEQERKLRRTHEDFYCPNGHVQGFYGKTKQEKLIEKLQAQVAQLTSQLEWRLEIRDEKIAEQAHEIRSLRSKLSWARRKGGLSVVQDESEAA